jgi:hypothetical protein
MKTIIIISLLCIASMSSYAQYKYTTNDHPKLKTGEVIPLTPAFNEPYTVTSEPACFMYKRPSGVVVMECPGVVFGPEQQVAASLYNQPGNNVTTENIDVNNSRAYTGNYPTVNNPVLSNYSNTYTIKNARIPANAVPAYPTTPYIQLQNPPCYKYTKRNGLKIMECNGVIFPPEHGE